MIIEYMKRIMKMNLKLFQRIIGSSQNRTGLTGLTGYDLFFILFILLSCLKKKIFKPCYNSNLTLP